MRVPPHYVQLAAALGLNSQNIIDSDIQATDFESLIEMHRKHITENRDDISSMTVCTDLTNQKLSPNANWTTESYVTVQKPVVSPKCVTDLSCMPNAPSISIHCPNNVSDLKSDVRQLNDCHQMDIDDQPMTLVPPPPISSVTEKNCTMPSQVNKPIMAKNYDQFICKKSYINNCAYDEQNYKENRLYEENQNNQNLLNQNCDPNNANNQGDDSMWRPW